ncbi:MAG TPA: TonB-dependent receptor [Cyclobacteriaceae bacterium]|nr:TonB-dependent receptor [Cyclobacteriaceae bacterium]
MKKLLFFIASIVCSTVYAQKTIGISGVVIDSLTQKPVEFATVALVDPSNNKPINGAVCDESGKFLIPKAAKGSYALIISFVGYANKKVSVQILEKNSEINLGTIILSPSVKMLHEVVVEGQKTLVEEKVDRTIYNAEQDLTTKGGDASDVLKRVPMLTVDIDGNVSLRGSANVKVLINNKPSTISANSVADALKQIPADMIKTVEVITSPSSKYDAEGSAGIINIVLKKNTLDGQFFNSDVTVGSRGSNFGANGSYRKGKMGFSLGGFIRPTYNVIGDYSNQQVTYVTDPVTLVNDTTVNLQTAHTRNDGTQGTYTFGWDYDINKNNSISTSVRYGTRSQNSYQDHLLTETYNISGQTNTLQNIISTSTGDNIDASLAYAKKFSKKNREFNFLGIYSKSNQTNGYVNTTVQEADQSVLQRHKNDNPGYTQETILQADYQEPIKENQLLEFGGKSTIRKVQSDYAYYVSNGSDGAYDIDSNHPPSSLDYNQYITAGYATYSITANDYTLKAGSRYEYTDIQATFSGAPDAKIPSYGVLVPSINLSKKLKDGKLIKISYNKRIQRPSLRDLNPTLQASNPKNATMGNPNLKPEYTHLAEIAYKTNIKAATLNLSAFMRYNTNDIQPARIIKGDTIISIFQNIGTEANYGISIFISVPISDRFTINGGTDTFYRILKNNSSDPILNATMEGLTPNFRMFGNYNFSNGWSIQFFGSYQGKSYNLQGYRTNPINHSVSVKKNLWGKNGSLTLGLDNFATPTYKVYSNLKSPYLIQNTTNTLYNFIVKVSFSYKIGKLAPERKKQLVEEEN